MASCNHIEYLYNRIDVFIRQGSMNHRFGRMLDHFGNFNEIGIHSLISRKVPFSGLEKGIKAAMTASTYRVMLDHEAT